MITSGGRVLGVVACDKTLEGAIARAYADTPKVTFDGAFYRRDIGCRALSAIKK
jgi:phosphoribosylamine-glycine ligase